MSACNIPVTTNDARQTVSTAYTTTILYECIALAIGDLVYLVLYVRNREQRTYTVSEKRSTLHSILGITLTNLDSFVIFGANHPDTSVYTKTLANLTQHCQRI